MFVDHKPFWSELKAEWGKTVFMTLDYNKQPNRKHPLVPLSLFPCQRIRPQARSDLQLSEEDLRSGVAHHPLPEGRLAKTAAGPESCHVGRHTRTVHTQHTSTSAKCFDAYCFCVSA